MTNTVQVIGGPSLGGTDVGFWGAWYSSGAVITKENSPISELLSFSLAENTPTESTYIVQVRYFNGVEFVIKEYPSTGDLNIVLDIGGGAIDSLQLPVN